MARKHEKPQAPPSRSWMWIAGIGVLTLLVVAFFLFRAQILTSLTLGELHSDDPKERKAARDKLAASDIDGIEETLEAVMLDGDKAFNVRTQVGQVLIQRGRLTFVERALRSDDLDGRIVALAVLHGHRHLLPEGGDDWFRREIVDAPEYRVSETLLDWLAKDGDMSRLHAVKIASELGLDESVPLIRKLVVPSRDGTLSRPERSIVSAAAGALITFKDCEAMLTLAEIATTSGDERVRLRLTQIVYQAASGPQAPCRDAVPQEKVKAMVLAGLDGAQPVRQGSLLLLAQQPAWAAENKDRLLSILDGEGGDNVYVRRAALAALAAVGEESFGRRLPRYFHADDFNIRSQAVSASRGFAGRPGLGDFYESCWIGMIRDETESDVAFDSALGGARDRARRIVGMPEEVTRAAKGRRERAMAFRKEMYDKGESWGVSRLAWADAWFDWWAGEQGLSDEDHLAAANARRAFWKAADANDVAGAKEALDGAPQGDGPLFTYEQGWLDAR